MSGTRVTLYTKAKRVGIVHGLMHTARRWEHLASCFERGESLQLPMRDSIDEIAQEFAKELGEYDVLIGHSMGGLVLDRALRRHGAPKPECLFFVATPFKGIRVPGALSPLLRIPKNKEIVRTFSLLTVTHPEYVDDIMLDDVMSQDFATAAKLLRELSAYRSIPVGVAGVCTYNVLAGQDHVCRPAYLYGGRNICFRESGHTIPLEYEEKFVRMVKYLAQTT